MSGDAPDAPASLAKYSRYRSVRKAAETQAAQKAAEEEAHYGKSATIQRSMSRYRRPRGTAENLTRPDAPPLPTTPNYTTEAIKRDAEGSLPVSDVRSYESQSGRSRQPRTRAGTTDLWDRNTNATRAPAVAPNQQPYYNGKHSFDSEPRLYEKSESPQKEIQERNIADILEVSKREDLKRLEATLAAAVPRPPSPSITSPTRDKHRLFGRLIAVSKPPVHEAAETAKPQPVKPKSSEQPRAILHGGGGVVPGIDAPVSAVNAGERRVLVRFKQSSINLPVTPTTTAKDLIYSAVNVLSQAVTPDAAVLIESYTQLGLERRLRRYEPIRDVMNSWDRDTQHALVVQASESPNHELDLELAHVPKEQPGPYTFQMYHSQRSGKWHKCFVTLLQNGQMFTSKKDKPKPSDKDVNNICHLSDFDIYTVPTQQQRKNLKLPKKWCCAIKSQQKTTMFLNTDNFVHFFSMDDTRVAEQFYNAIQSWRSWYLVTKMGEGQKKPLTTKPRTSHSIRAPQLDETPYTIGTFSPLIDDVDNLAASLARSSSDPFPSAEVQSPRQIPFHLRNSGFTPPFHPRDRHPPPVSLTRRPEPTAEDEEFAPKSLLGRTYTQRQRAVQDAAVNSDLHSGPFTDGPSLLNSVSAPSSTHRYNSLKRGLSTRTARPPTSSAANDRSGSLGRVHTHEWERERIPALPTPLVDLTPKFKEPPQWSKEGRGHGVVAPAGIPLVDVAGSRHTESAGAIGVQDVLLRREEPQLGGSGNGMASPRTGTLKERSGTMGSRERAGTMGGRERAGTLRKGPSGAEGPFVPGGLVGGT